MPLSPSAPAAAPLPAHKGAGTAGCRPSSLGPSRPQQSALLGPRRNLPAPPPLEQPPALGHTVQPAELAAAVPSTSDPHACRWESQVSKSANRKPWAWPSEHPRPVAAVAAGLLSAVLVAAVGVALPAMPAAAADAGSLVPNASEPAVTVASEEAGAQQQQQQQRQEERLGRRQQQKQPEEAEGQAAASGAGPTPVFCERDSLSGLLRQFAGRQEGFDSGLQIDGLLAYYRRLGCSPQQIQEAVGAAAPSQASRQAQPRADALRGAGPAPTSAPGELDAGPLPLALPSTLVDQLQVAAWELLAASVAAAALAAYQARPRGWARGDLLEVRASPIAGRGVFARAPIPRGTVLGSYPGRLRSGADMVAKCSDAPLAASYAFRTGDGRFLDPTDSCGQPSPYPQPGWPWPLPADVLLAFVNEPPKGSPGTNASVEDGPQPGELLFVASTDIPAGAEVFIDYGISYDRSGYGRGSD